MAKPILVIRHHHKLNPDYLSNEIGSKMPDYHVLCVRQQDLYDPTFEVYNMEKEPEIDYEELKKLINAKA